MIYTISKRPVAGGASIYVETFDGSDATMRTRLATLQQADAASVFAAAPAATEATVPSPYVNRQRWMDAADTIRPSFFAKLPEMFAETRAQIQMPSGNYTFDTPLTGRNGLILRCERGARLIPTFQPVGAARATPMFDIVGADINRLEMQLDAGINTIRTLVRVGAESRIGFFRATSVDLNNNRTAAGSADLVSGALLISGDNVQVWAVYLSRFDRGWAVVDCDNIGIGHITNLETVMGGYVHGVRNLRVDSGHTTGPDDPSLPNAFGRGVMTPGANALLLNGCSDSSFGVWRTYDILEHGIRIGKSEAPRNVPNERISFGHIESYRPYGCGYKQDDADAFKIKGISIGTLYTEDVGHGNWFGGANYLNWFESPMNSPNTDVDGNKSACAIRNSQYVTIGSFVNRNKLYDQSGYNGLFVERSNNVKIKSVTTEYSRTHGVVIQSGGTTEATRIEIGSATTRNNAGDGLRLNASPSNADWSGVVVRGLDSQGNAGYGYSVTARQDGGSPFVSSLASRIEGFTRGNALGERSVASVVATDPDLIDEVREIGTFVPVVTTATPGTFSATYTTQTGRYERKGKRVHVVIDLTFTPTLGTASGNLRITGLPYIARDNLNALRVILTDAALKSWNSRSMLVPTVQTGSTAIEIRGLGPAVAASPLGISSLTDGAAHSLRIDGEFDIN